MQPLEGEFRCMYCTFSLFPGPSRKAASQAFPINLSSLFLLLASYHQAYLITCVYLGFCHCSLNNAVHCWPSWVGRSLTLEANSFWPGIWDCSSPHWNASSSSEICIWSCLSFSPLIPSKPSPPPHQPWGVQVWDTAGGKEKDEVRLWLQSAKGAAGTTAAAGGASSILSSLSSATQWQLHHCSTCGQSTAGTVPLSFSQTGQGEGTCKPPSTCKPKSKWLSNVSSGSNGLRYRNIKTQSVPASCSEQNQPPLLPACTSSQNKCWCHQ